MCDMYRCLDCGNIFKAEDAEEVQEYVGEFWGQPAYETWAVCPKCVQVQVARTIQSAKAGLNRRLARRIKNA